MNDYLEIRSAYLAHYKTKGAKKGIRRFQSYEVAPNPSGYVGQEVGEAAKQSQRVGGDDEGSDKKKMTRQEKRALRKEMRNYDYRQSDQYKNASSAQKRTMDNTYNNRQMLLGTKAANRASYMDNKYGAEAGKKEVKKELAKQVVLGTAATVALAVAPEVLSMAINRVNKAKVDVHNANVAMDMFAKSAGLNTVSAREVGKTPFASIGKTLRYEKMGEAVRKKYYG